MEKPIEVICKCVHGNRAGWWVLALLFLTALILVTTNYTNLFKPYRDTQIDTVK